MLRELADTPDRFYVRSQSYGGQDVAGTPTAPRSAAPTTARTTERACPPGSVPEDGFRDVPEGGTHEANVDCVVWWRVAAGRGSDSYDPAGTVSRGQMATFPANAIRGAHRHLPEGSQDWFDDDDGSPHERSINALREAGIVEGVAHGAYRPDREVTRADRAGLHG